MSETIFAALKSLAGLVLAPAAGAASSWFASNTPTRPWPVSSLGFGDLGDVFLAA